CAVALLLPRPAGLRPWIATVPPALPVPPVPGTANDSVVALVTVAGIVPPLKSTVAPARNARPFSVVVEPCDTGSVNGSSSGFTPTLTRLLSVPSARRTNTCCLPPPITLGKQTDIHTAGVQRA